MLTIIVIINKVPKDTRNFIFRVDCQIYNRIALALGITIGFQIQDNISLGYHLRFSRQILGFVCLMLNVPVNNFSVMLGRSHHFLGIASRLGGKFVLFKDPTRHLSGAQTTDLWIRSPRCKPPGHRAPSMDLVNVLLTPVHYSIALAIQRNKIRKG